VGGGDAGGGGGGGGLRQYEDSTKTVLRQWLAVYRRRA
jgi:hypothetical protein